MLDLQVIFSSLSMVRSDLAAGNWEKWVNNCSYMTVKLEVSPVFFFFFCLLLLLLSWVTSTQLQLFRRGQAEDRNICRDSSIRWIDGLDDQKLFFNPEVMWIPINFFYCWSSSPFVCAKECKIMHAQKSAYINFWDIIVEVKRSRT